VAGTEVLGRLGGDALGRRVGAPVAPPARPQPGRVAGLAHLAQAAGREDPVRWAIDGGGDPRRLLDGRSAAAQILAQHAGREPQLVAVAEAVQRDAVPGGPDLGREARIALHLLADEEERGAGAGAVE